MNSVFLGILTLSVVILVVFLIPTAIQVRKTAKEAEKFMSDTNTSLKPVLKELHETLEGFNNISKGIDNAVNDIGSFTKAVRDVGDTASDINRIIKGTGADVAIKAAGIGIGVRTALNVFLKGLRKGG